MALTEIGRPLQTAARDGVLPGPGEAQPKVRTCGAGRTDLHVVDSELSDVRTPIIPGHEIVAEAPVL